MKRGPPKASPNYVVDPATGDVHIRPREKLLERLPATESRNAAFDLLHEQLAVATEFFQNYGDGGRYGVYRAMSDLIQYLTSRGIPHAAIRPIEAVIEAIVDADSGTASPIFEPVRTQKGGTPPKSVMQLQFEGTLAVVMECCVLHCKAEGQRPYTKPAAVLAEKMIRQSSWPSSFTARKLEELRERIMQQKDRFSPDRVIFDELMSGEVVRSQPLEYARLLLSNQLVNTIPKVSE